MTIAPFLLGLAIFCALLRLGFQGISPKADSVRFLAILLAIALGFASVVAALLPGGL